MKTILVVVVDAPSYLASLVDSMESDHGGTQKVESTGKESKGLPDILNDFADVDVFANLYVEIDRHLHRYPIAIPNTHPSTPVWSLISKSPLTYFSPILIYLYDLQPHLDHMNDFAVIAGADVS